MLFVCLGVLSSAAQVTYTFKCSADVLRFAQDYDFSSQTLSNFYDAPYTNGEYQVTVEQTGPSVYVALTDYAVEQGYQITNATFGGAALTGMPGSINEGKMFAFPTYNYPDGGTCVVEVSAPTSSYTYTFNCSADVLRFASDLQFQNVIEATYADKAYTVTVHEQGPSIYVGLTTTAVADGYIIESAMIGETSLYVNENTAFAFPTYDQASGTVCDVKAAIQKTLIFKCAEDVLVFGTGIATPNGSPEVSNFFEVPYENGQYTLTTTLTSLYVGLNPEIPGYTIKSAAPISVNQIVMGKLFALNLNNFSNQTEFDVVLEAPATTTYTFNCSENVLRFASDYQFADVIEATYADGAYTLSVTERGASIYVGLTTTAAEEGYIIQSATVKGTSLPVNEGTAFAFPTSTYLNGTVCDVTIGKAQTFVFNCAADVIEFGTAIDGSTLTVSDIFTPVYADGAYTIKMVPGAAIYGGFKSDYEDYKMISLTREDGSIVTAAVIANKVFMLNTRNWAEGAVLTINYEAPVVTVNEYTYTFEGVEGLQIKHNATVATYSEGVYTLAGLAEDVLNNYPVEISVTADHQDEIGLVEVSSGEDLKFEATRRPTDTVLYIPASQLPKADTEWVITTAPVEEPSTQEITVYLTIDDPEAVEYWMYGVAGAERQSFNADGKETLTITSTQYVVEVYTSVEVIKITTDVENTLNIPAVPSQLITLDLSNCKDGQTVSLYTKESGISSIIGAEEGVKVYNLNGVQVKNVESLQPGIYVVNGKKMVVK